MIHFTTSDFDKKKCAAYQLSILIRMDSLVYFISDTETSKALQLGELSFPNSAGKTFNHNAAVEAALDREPLFNELFRKVKVALQEEAVPVPSRLFNDSEVNTYLQELSSVPVQHEVLYDRATELDINMVYAPENQLVRVVKNKFPTATIFSETTAFLQGSRQMLNAESEHQVFLHFSNEEKMLVTVFEDGKLLLSNRYSYTSANDVLYFTLLVYDQFKLNPETVPLTLSGQVVQDSEIYKILYRYVLHLSFMPKPTFLQFHNGFRESIAHFFFNLYSLADCK